MRFHSTLLKNDKECIFNFLNPLCINYITAMGVKYMLHSLGYISFPQTILLADPFDLNVTTAPNILVHVNIDW